MPQTVDIGVNTDESFFKKKTVLVPSVESNHVLMIGETNIHYTLKPTRCFLDAIKNEGGSLTFLSEDKTLLRATWGSHKEKSEGILTQWKIKFLTKFKDMEKVALQRFSNNVFNSVRKVIEELYQEFKAEFVTLKSGCFMFVFWHSSEMSARNMIDYQSHVHKVLKRLFANVSSTEIKFTITPSINRDVDSSLLWNTRSIETQTQRTQPTLVDDTSNMDIKNDLKEVRQYVTSMRDTLVELKKTVEKSSDKPIPAASPLENIQEISEQLYKRLYTRIAVTPPQEQIAAPAFASRDLSGIITEGNKPMSDSYATSKHYKQEGKAGYRQELVTNPFSETEEHETTKSLSVKEFRIPSAENRDTFHEHRPVERRSNTARESPTVPLVTAEPYHLYQESIGQTNEFSAAIAIERNYDRAKIMLNNLHIRSTRKGEVDVRVERLTNIVAIALEKELPPPPKASGQDTVLCLDVSDSLGEAGFKEVKAAAHRFIDGIEDIAEKYALEENVSVVGMGGGAKIYRQLTNDFGAVRDAIDRMPFGGRSPIFEALVICVSAIKEKGGSILISGVHRINPRIIFITDGFVTSDRVVDGPDSMAMDQDQESKMDVIKLINSIREAEPDFNPITWVSVGDKHETNTFLESLAKIGKGKMIKSRDIQTLCNHYNIESNIGKIYCYMKNNYKSWDGSAEMLESVTSALVGDMEPRDKEAVIHGVKHKLEFDIEEVPDPDHRPNEFNNVYEVGGILPLGTRVVRGPDWQYEDQDLGGPGTVINHSSDKGALWVHWDLNQSNCRYKYGGASRMEVREVENQPRFLQGDEFIEIGVRVKRGPDWSHGDQDGGRGNTGVVIRTRQDAVVKVKWLATGNIESYKFGMDGQFDLAVCDPEDFMTDPSTDVKLEKELHSSYGATNMEGSEPTRAKPNMIWQWRESMGNWRLYDKNLRDKLEKEYKRRPTGSCLIRKEGGNVRVLFSHPMHERIVGEGLRYEVQRLAVSDDELSKLEEDESVFGYS